MRLLFFKICLQYCNSKFVKIIKSSVQWLLCEYEINTCCYIKLFETRMNNFKFYDSQNKFKYLFKITSLKSVNKM